MYENGVINTVIISKVRVIWVINDVCYVIKMIIYVKGSVILYKDSDYEGSIMSHLRSRSWYTEDKVILEKMSCQRSNRP